MKFLTSRLGMIVLAIVLGFGTTAGLVFMQRSSLNPETDAKKKLPPRLWGFNTDEVDTLIAELKRQRGKLDEREKNMDQTAAHIEAERQELEKVKATIKAMRDELSREIPDIQAGEIKNLKTLALTYSSLNPPAAVAIFKELDDLTVVKILAMMKSDKVGAVLEEMSHTQDNDQTMAKRAARISDKLRLLKQPKTQATTP